MDISLSLIALYVAFLLCVGSALGCLSYRLPKQKEHQWKQEASQFLGLDSLQNTSDTPQTPPRSFMQGRSFCPACHHTLTAKDMIPLISYLINKGHCRFCHTKVSIRYPVIELGYTLVLLPLLWTATSPQELFLFILLFSALALATIVDIECLFIPDETNLIILACAFSLPLLNHTPLENHVLGMLIGYGLLYLLRAVYLRIRKIEMLGLGDVKLLATVGAWLGIYNLSNILLIASLTAIVFALFKGKQRHSQIPFGPFIAGAGIVVFYAQAFW